MYALGSRLGPSDDILYNRKTCSVFILNMGLKLELNLLKQLVFILLCLFLTCAEYELDTFGATSDEISLMAFYLNPGFINVSKKHEFRQVLKFVELRKTCVLTVLKISYKPTLLQLTEVVS